MGWNNKVFNINGRGVRMLESAIDLACDDGGDGKFKRKVVASIFDPLHGLIWLWTDLEGAARFPAPLTSKQVAEISMEWLKSEEAASVKCNGWDRDADHDGDNSKGWRIYCEEWGYVGKATWRAAFAVRPVYLWHGK